jgi:Flp pilus assembly pilin Flp
MPSQTKGTGLLAKFLKDETGFVDAAHYILMVTVICIGVIAGLSAIRDSVVQELGDFALGLENLDHTYTVACSFATFGYIDAELGGNDVAGEPPGCIEICLAPAGEGAIGGGGGGGPLEATPE